MQVLISGSTIRDLIIRAIQSVIISNNQQIDTIQAFDPFDSQSSQKQNQQGIQIIEQQNRIMNRFIDKLRGVDGFSVSVLKLKLSQLWFERHMPEHTNVSYQAKLKAIGLLEGLIELGFDKLSGCNTK